MERGGREAWSARRRYCDVDECGFLAVVFCLAAAVVYCFSLNEVVLYKCAVNNTKARCGVTA